MTSKLATLHVRGVTCKESTHMRQSPESEMTCKLDLQLPNGYLYISIEGRDESPQVRRQRKSSG